MDINATLDNIFKKVEVLAQRLDKSQLLNKELKEELRALDNQLNDYTELIGDLQMENVELKKNLEKKK
jgi:chromosome segregation ATPase